MALKGILRDITFVELCDLLSRRERTGRIEITHGNKWAMIVVNKGVLWHAEPRGFRGVTPDQLVFQVAQLRNGIFLYQRVQVLPSLDRSLKVEMRELLAASHEDQPEDNTPLPPGATKAVRGTFRDLSFLDMVDLISHNKMTCRMEITSEARRAMVIAVEGELLQIEHRGLKATTPDAAISEIADLKDGSFVFQRLGSLPELERQIMTPTAKLVEAALERKAENEQTGTSADGRKVKIKQIVRVKQGSEARARYQPAAAQRLLALVDGERTQMDMLKMSGMEANQADATLKKLLADGIVEVIEVEDKPKDEAEAEKGAAE